VSESEHDVTTLEQLRAIYPPPKERTLRKVQDHLDGHCRGFIALSPFVLVATASAAGWCDVSPKGGPPGFVEVPSQHHLLIPDATGNRLLDGLQNLLENPQVGLVFLIPGLGETLRVNGAARMTTDPALIGGATGGKPARLAIVVEVREAYIHCAKALIRSELWDPESWPAPEQLPSPATILADHRGMDVAASAAALAEGYRTQL
jgi:uncharacterized protein